MATELKPIQGFRLTRILNDDPLAHALTLLGDVPSNAGTERSQAILRIEKTALSSDTGDSLSAGTLLNRLELEGHTDIYSWMHGWFASDRDHPDVKINMICPATEVHIRKYSCQEMVMVHETPEIYARIVQPYIASFPASRTQWVDDILTGKSEADKVFYRDADPTYGFVLLPDMKWDLKTLTSLYLVALAISPEIRSLRDLRKRHLVMLRAIKREASAAVHKRWGLDQGALRFFVHYQPSYYHFHVHVVNANYVGTIGSTVGQAHLLDDLISLLELDPDDGPSILERMTFTYGLGDNHGLFSGMKAAQNSVLDN